MFQGGNRLVKLGAQIDDSGSLDPGFWVFAGMTADA